MTLVSSLCMAIVSTMSKMLCSSPCSLYVINNYFKCLHSHEQCVCIYLFVSTAASEGCSHRRHYQQRRIIFCQRSCLRKLTGCKQNNAMRLKMFARGNILICSANCSAFVCIQCLSMNCTGFVLRSNFKYHSCQSKLLPSGFDYNYLSSEMISRRNKAVSRTASFTNFARWHEQIST